MSQFAQSDRNSFVETIKIIKFAGSYLVFIVCFFK